MSENDKEITALIRKLVPIAELTEKIQNRLITNADLVELKKGKYLFRKGDRDHFSFYLLSGEIELVSDRQIHDTIKGGCERALYPMAQLQPRQFSALAKSAVQILKINRTVLDKLLVISKQSSHSKVDLSDTISGPGKLEVNEIDEQDNVDWMTRMLQSNLFMKIPSDNIQRLFALLESNEYKSGDTVIEQDQTGQSYFVIQEGRCIVSRKAGPSSNPIKLAELKAGDSFGEESLLMDTTCNATITMATDGVLMKLSKENFVQLIQKPTLQTVQYAKARELIKVGAKWLDVRFESEHSESHIIGSQNIPLGLLRAQIKKLSSDTQYILYCDTGGRSSAAAFLMTERGFKVFYLEGGLISNPDISELKNAEKQIKKTKTDESSQEDEIIKPVSETQSKEQKSEPQKSEPQSKTVSDTEAAEKLQQMKLNFEQWMKQEKENLSEQYSTAQRMLDSAKLIKSEAEKTKKKLEEEARNDAVEADTTKQKVEQETSERISALETSKEKLEKKNKTLITKRVELENQLRVESEARELLEKEKLQLIEKMSDADEELEQFKNDKKQMEVEVNALKQKAKQIITEYQKKHQQLLVQEEITISEQLENLELGSVEHEPDVVSEKNTAPRDNNLQELHRIKQKKDEASLSIKPEKTSANQDEKKPSGDSTEQLMDEVSSQLGTGK